MVSPPETPPVGSVDAIDHLAGIAPDSPLARLRAERPEIVRHAQGSFLTLLEPDDPAGLARAERELIALRVAVLTRTDALAAWHRQRLAALGVDAATIAAAEAGPDAPGLPTRAAALLRHTDRLTRELGRGTPEHIAALTAAGLGPREIVTASQLIGFLSFQVRALAGLRILAEDV
jgi:CMD domain protein